MSRILPLFIAVCLLVVAVPVGAQEPVADGVAATAPVSTTLAATEPMSTTVAATEPVSGTVAATAPVSTTVAADSRALFHDAVSTAIDTSAGMTTTVGTYEVGVQPWLDLLVQLPDGEWYGPERNPDWLYELPLPAGLAWTCTGGFTCLPNGEAWWIGPAPEGQAVLTGLAEGVTLNLRVEMHAATGNGEAKETPKPPAQG